MKPIVFLAGLLLGASLLGCQQWHHQSRVEQHWGDSYESNRSAMVANPDAPPWGSGPVGLDPGSAEKVAERYYEGQREGQIEQPRPVLLIQPNRGSSGR